MTMLIVMLTPDRSIDRARTLALTLAKLLTDNVDHCKVLDKKIAETKMVLLSWLGRDKSFFGLQKTKNP